MINAAQFFEALDQLEAQKGITKESILAALKEAMRKALIKQLGGGDDAVVEVIIDEQTANIEIYQVKKVVEEVHDDYLEVSLDEARKFDAKVQVGDDYKIYVKFADLSKLFAMTVKSVLHQKLAEAEKAALYITYKDKIGEMITGVVEKVDDRSAIVNIGRTSVYLSSREMIGEESFDIGQQIRLYVSDVSSSEKGAQISVTRSDPGFLRRIFEEEIHEIYDGTVIIKNIAREAGIRSKVAVFSNDQDVDPTGACIGHDGGRIKKIVAQLGNARDKEKIDIIQYNDDPGLYIVEALRPATVVGVKLNEQEHSAIAVVKDEQLSLAIGRKGANARLGVKLTGWNIDIKEETMAKQDAIDYLTVEVLAQKAHEKQRMAAYQRYIDSIQPTEKDVVPETHTTSVNVEAQVAKEETREVAVEAPVAKEEAVEQPVVTNIKITTDLETLERELESQKEKNKQSAPKTRRPRKISDEEVKEGDKSQKPYAAPAPDADNKPYMQIYSEEELAELEKEAEKHTEPVAEDEEIDYDEYDEYYDDEEK
ncbi:MAG: transcription termination factor NusA [Bacilli bacterium]|jgi:N utilization substance protein A